MTDQRERMTLQFFEDVPALERFANAVGKTYLSMLSVSEAGGLSTGDMAQAVMLSRLVNRMLQYKADQAAQITGHAIEFLPQLEAEIEKLWPMFRERLDEELAEAKEAWEAQERDGTETVQ